MGRVLTDTQRAAHREYVRRHRAKARAARILVDGRWFAPAATHGIPSGYDWHGCQCHPCTRADSQRRAQTRRRPYPVAVGQIWQPRTDMASGRRSGPVRVDHHDPDTNQWRIEPTNDGGRARYVLGYHLHRYYRLLEDTT